MGYAVWRGNEKVYEELFPIQTRTRERGRLKAKARGLEARTHKSPEKIYYNKMRCCTVHTTNKVVVWWRILSVGHLLYSLLVRFEFREMFFHE